MLTFERLEPGTRLGVDDQTFDQCILDRWTELFPADRTASPVMPAAMAAAVIMRAYMRILTSRPPGNVHGGITQTLRRLPRLGDTMATEIRCLDKEIRNGRRWVRFGGVTRDDAGDTLFDAELVLLWAR